VVPSLFCCIRTSPDQYFPSYPSAAKRLSSATLLFSLFVGTYVYICFPLQSIPHFVLQCQ
jgi:hypothetical protein